MWKLILILVLVIYLLNKISLVLFRVMGRPQSPPSSFGKRNEGSGHREAAAPKTSSTRGNIKGGEYVDYEEVK